MRFKLGQKIIDKLRNKKNKSNTNNIENQYKEWRKAVITNAKSCGENLYVGGHSFVTYNTELGNYVHFNGMQIHGHGKCIIGDHFHSGVECIIITSNHNYDTGKAIPYDDTNICKTVEIGNFVWMGSRVTVLPGAKIGEGVVIQAGSVVHGQIPDYAVVGGNPAKVIKYRNIEHFKKLKEQGCYLGGKNAPQDHLKHLRG